MSNKRDPGRKAKRFDCPLEFKSIELSPVERERTRASATGKETRYDKVDEIHWNNCGDLSLRGDNIGVAAEAETSILIEFGAGLFSKRINFVPALLFM